MGCPQTLYNGGILQATVRYFDLDRQRPGVPEDVAVLVDEIRNDRVGIQLVNTDTSHARNVIVQAGAFGEHAFTELRYSEEGGGENSILYPTGWISEKRPQHTRSTRVEGKHFTVRLPPSTVIRLEAGMKRFVNQPSYAFPWH